MPYQEELHGLVAKLSYSTLQTLEAIKRRLVGRSFNSSWELQK
jgi:hypothetical protein